LPSAYDIGHWLSQRLRRARFKPSAIARYEDEFEALRCRLRIAKRRVPPTPSAPTTGSSSRRAYIAISSILTVAPHFRQIRVASVTASAPLFVFLGGFAAGAWRLRCRVLQM